ncbi:hypothetical protein CHUAL_004340 [Chamberlinius hualienensis]
MEFNNGCHFCRVDNNNNQIRFYCPSCHNSLENFYSINSPSRYRNTDECFIVTKRNEEILSYKLSHQIKIRQDTLTLIKSVSSLFTATTAETLNYAQEEGHFRGCWSISCQDSYTLELYWRNIQGGGRILVVNDNFKDLETIRSMAKLIRQVANYNHFDIEMEFYYRPGLYIELGIDDWSLNM